MIGSCFAKKKEKSQNYMSLGYLCFIICIAINAITLGTWSFSSQTESVPLIARIIGMFNITKNAGLIEMIGQLLITCSFANKHLVITYKKETQTRKIKDIKWTKQETIFLILGIVLMFIGAMIESNSIIALS